MEFSLITTTKTSTQAVNDQLFGAPVNKVLLAQAIRVYLSCARQGTSKVKTRAEVARRKQKWFKQKGTGNARHGARTPNIFVGGGISHGPDGTQNWLLSLSPVMKRGALISALSAQAEKSALINDITATKTKDMVELLKSDEKKAVILVVIAAAESANIRALKNIKNVTVASAERISALEVVQANKILYTESAITALENRLLGEKKVVTPKSKVAKVVKPKVTKSVVEKPLAKAKPAKKVAKKTEK
ncbi:MAG: 50S ribosomal protein L4 [bacterium]|nr:50S ribosomal protein L4 [bacterium]